MCVPLKTGPQNSRATGGLAWWTTGVGEGTPKRVETNVETVADILA